MTEAKYQKVAFDPNANMYELFDDYGGVYIEEIEFRRLYRAVKKHTPEWLKGL